MRSTPPPPFPISFFHKSTPISFSSPPNYTHFVSHFPFFTRLLTWSPICSSPFSFFSDMLSVFPARYSAVSGGQCWLEVGSWFSLILQTNTPFQLHFSLIFLLLGCKTRPTTFNGRFPATLTAASGGDTLSLLFLNCVSLRTLFEVDFWIKFSLLS